MKRFRNETELRQYVEKKLGPLPEEIWGSLKAENFISEVLYHSDEYPDSLDNLLERAEFELYRGGHRHARRRIREEKVPPPADTSYVIRSRLLAMRAAKLPYVRHFRRKYLPNGLLSPEEVTSWIDAIWEKEKNNIGAIITVAVDFPVDGEPPQFDYTPPPDPYAMAFDVPALIRTAEAIPAGTPVVGFKLTRLEWVDPMKPNDINPSRLISCSGVLYALQQTAQKVASDFDCQEAEAVTFILTGLPFSFEYINIQQDAFHKAIKFKVYPEVSPAKLAKAYSRFRGIKARWRPPSPKTLEMVSFRLDHLGMSWRECWEAWNAEHPDKRYPSPERMKRDYHRAVKRMI